MFLGNFVFDAIVQEILIPYLKENYSINSYLENDDIKGLLNAVLKSYAEDIKINLSFNNTYNVLTDLGVLPEDDDGEEMELDIDVTSEDMKRILSPIFKKATDLTNKLLKRNNLTGNKVTSLLLVGGPTYSPILREMLTKEICKPDTSVDPMTVVAKGAAIYATTVIGSNTSIWFTNFFGQHFS
jgi:molecular chaperone DnaK